MHEQLTRYFTATHRLRRSERKLVRSGAVVELQELLREVKHPRLLARINTVLNQHYAASKQATAAN